MIALGNATTTVTVTLAGAKNTNDCPVTVFFTDEPVIPTATAVAVNDKQQSTTNGVTAAVICAAGPGGVGFRRRIQSLNLFNADLAAITATIKIVDTANSTTTLQQVTLQTLEQLNYEQGYGFEALDVNGAVKSQNSLTSSAASTADSKAVSAALIASTATSTLTIVSSLQSGASVQSFTSTTFSTVSSGLSAISVAISGASAQSFTSTTFSTISSSASLGLIVSSLQSAASVQSFTSTTWSTTSSAVSLGLLVSSLQSLASVQSFTATTFSTVSSATSRVKSSFAW